MEYYILVLKADRRGNTLFELIPSDKKELDVDFMHEICECRCIDISPMRLGVGGLDFKCDLIYDDEFLVNGNPSINKVASLMFGYLAHFECLCGNVIVARSEVDDSGERNSVAFTEEEIMKMLRLIGKLTFICQDTYFELQEPAFELYTK